MGYAGVCFKYRIVGRRTYTAPVNGTTIDSDGANFKFGKLIILKLVGRSLVSIG